MHNEREEDILKENKDVMKEKRIDWRKNKEMHNEREEDILKENEDVMKEKRID